ncbi:bleomycin resistance protein [Winogradskyella echinorum]|uniref:Bleomycin resistance protein n=1 Tax=Winogradskyella echinorum TaxID=538189 RepID=A0ABR6XXS3_9FLAO|nr:bleomycin resistance protein [Winogradskyella echinorum]MBC3845303.1 bleomycin resistance protein [Winogradskyella echinorum]MBC5749651.1 bleomycin resistance protein [Winogradskyella echinorum]
METSFHISLPCLNVEDTKNFYINYIGASVGRTSENWIDINLFGHQLTFIKAEKFNFNSPNYVFEGKLLPSFHLGVIVNESTWNGIYNNLKEHHLDVVNKTTFLQDKLGEHSSFFLKDPNDYMLEFKNFKTTNDIFKS